MQAQLKKQSSELATVQRLVVGTLVIAVLYFAQDVLIPFALALLVSFVLAPPIGWLERIRFKRVAAVLVVLVLSFAVTSVVLWLGVTQFAEIVTKVPDYQANLHRKIQGLRSPAGSALTKAVASIEQITNEVNEVGSGPAPSPHTSPSTDSPKILVDVKAPDHAPVQVEIVSRKTGLFGSLVSVGPSIVHVLGTLAAVALFALFMMMHRGDIRDRFLHLVGSIHLNATTTALDDAVQGVSRYLLAQLAVNGAFGILMGLGLFWIGVPNAPFWGVLGFTLRFIPYVGTIIAGLCPLLLAVSVFDGWSKPLLCLGQFVVVELTMSAAVEPWLYGAHTGISSLAIIVSTAFWTLMWGPVGLVLSTPLTVCLLVLGRNVPTLQFLNVLLGEKVELPIHARYYQRLLAMDDTEAQEIVEKYALSHSISELFDVVLIPGLILAEQDRQDTGLTMEQEAFFYESTKLIIEDLIVTPETPKVQEPLPLRLICFPARNQSDELVSQMLGVVMAQRDVVFVALDVESRRDPLEAVETDQADIFLISALPPFAVMHARSVCRRVRRRFPQVKIVLGLWGATGEVEELQKRAALDCFDSIVTGIQSAELQLTLPIAKPVPAIDA